MRYGVISMEIRHDRAALNEPGRKGAPRGVRAPRQTASGSWVYEGVIARVHGPGDGLKYPKRTEYRDLSELKQIIRLAPGTPIVVQHPPRDEKTGGRLVLGRDTVVGRILTARLDGVEAIAEFEVSHPLGLKAIQTDGLRELSLGYGVTRLDSKGYQRGVEIDHLALVEFARCGAACSIRTDCVEKKPCPCQVAGRMQDSNPNPEGTKNMATPKNPTAHVDHADALRSLEAQRADAAAQATTSAAEAEAEKLRADTAEGRILVLETEIAELKTTIAAGAVSVESEAVQAQRLRADAAEAQVRQFDATYEARLRQRVALERQAWVVMGDGFRMDDLSDREIQCTVVKHLDSNADVSASQPDGIIRGRFLALTERHDSTARSLARVSEIQSNTERADSAEKARVAKRDSWKNPLPNARRARS